MHTDDRPSCNDVNIDPTLSLLQSILNQINFFHQNVQFSQTRFAFAIQVFGFVLWRLSKVRRYRCHFRLLWQPVFQMGFTRRRHLVDRVCWVAGTRITQASECFVHWKDCKCDHEWGLNFTTPADARCFRECCLVSSAVAHLQNTQLKLPPVPRGPWHGSRGSFGVSNHRDMLRWFERFPIPLTSRQPAGLRRRNWEIVDVRDKTRGSQRRRGHQRGRHGLFADLSRTSRGSRRSGIWAYYCIKFSWGWKLGTIFHQNRTCICWEITTIEMNERTNKPTNQPNN